MARLCPTDPDQVPEMVAEAAAAGTPLRLCGSDSRRDWGGVVDAATVLDLSGLTGITLYEPAELVLTARAGTPLAAVEAALAEQGQHLAFEPPDPRPLFGGRSRGSLGGALAGNLSGPRRLTAGAARDHFLGARAVSGRGEAFKTGGRVVKNVSGYDLCKLLAGSFGTLAALTEVTVKVMPVPETSVSLWIPAPDAQTGVAALTAALAGPHEPSGAAWLPDGAPIGRTGAGALVRLEGFAPSVAARAEALSACLGRPGAVDRLDSETSRAAWHTISDVAALVPAAGPLWRLSVAPGDGPAVWRELADLDPRGYLDWGGGLIWLVPGVAADDGQAGRIRAVVGRRGGHATLVRAPEALRRAVPVFMPQPPALAALAERLRAGFDPLGLLNPGRV